MNDVIAAPLSKAALSHMLKALRLGYCFSLRDLSAASAVSAGQILRMENGEYNVSLDVLDKICRALGAPLGLVVECCSMPEWEVFDKRLEHLASFQDAMKKHRYEARRDVPFLRRQVAATAAFMRFLLASANPKMWARRVRYPVDGIASRFDDYTELIDVRFAPSARRLQTQELDSDCFSFMETRGFWWKAGLDEALKSGLRKAFIWRPANELRTVLLSDFSKSR